MTFHRNHLLCIITLTAFLFSCGKFEDIDGNNGEFSQKLAAQPFVAPLYGKMTKTVVVDVSGSKKIDFVTLDTSGDYQLFSIDNLSVNNSQMANSGNASSFVYDNITLLPQSTATTSQANKLYLTVTYKASQALKKTNEPHKATALISLDQKGMVSLEFQGLVQGVCEDCKAKLGPTLSYEVKDGAFDLYLCDAQAIKPEFRSNGKVTLPDGTDPAIPFNMASVPLKEVTLYMSDDRKTVVVDAGDESKKVAASIPSFDIAVPGGQPVATVPAKIKKGTQASCPVAPDKGFACSDKTKSGIELDVLNGSLAVSPLELTTGSVTPKSTGCDSFGTWQGSGTVDPDNPQDLTLIGVASVSDNQPLGDTVTKTGIDGALVLAVIRLTPKQ